MCDVHPCKKGWVDGYEGLSQIVRALAFLTNLRTHICLYMLQVFSLLTSSLPPPLLLLLIQAGNAQTFAEWLCAVGAPGSFIEGTVIEDRRRSSSRLFSVFIVD